MPNFLPAISAQVNSQFTRNRELCLGPIRVVEGTPELRNINLRAGWGDIPSSSSLLFLTAVFSFFSWCSAYPQVRYQELIYSSGPEGKTLPWLGIVSFQYRISYLIITNLYCTVNGSRNVGYRKTMLYLRL